MSHTEHQALAPDRARVFVLTVSDTRTDETDTAGRAIIDLLLDAGHAVAGKAIESDEPSRVAELVRQQAAIADVDAIITTGGTSRLDSTSTAAARPLASSNAIRSRRVIAPHAAAISCRASSSGIVSLIGRISLFTFHFSLLGLLNQMAQFLQQF